MTIESNEPIPAEAPADPATNDATAETQQAETLPESAEAKAEGENAALDKALDEAVDPDGELTPAAQPEQSEGASAIPSDPSAGVVHGAQS